ncbi:YbaB/EbfC family nucleoid-associated protein [Actinomadura harenae]|nr:YbaB/EbfC family nucleoid-associated protein [Actinomadura harenae]
MTLERLTRLGRKLEELHRRLDAKLLECRSADGLVAATVTGNGDIVDLTIDQRAITDPDARRRLDAVITEVIGQANAKSRRLREAAETKVIESQGR